MQRNSRVRAAIVFVAAVIPMAACGHKKNEESAAGTVVPPSGAQPIAVPATSYSQPAAGIDSAKAAPKHHSKMKGAAAGAVNQHERNKHKK